LANRKANPTCAHQARFFGFFKRALRLSVLCGGDVDKLLVAPLKIMAKNVGAIRLA
jgi:hypothetical protein